MKGKKRKRGETEKGRESERDEKKRPSQGSFYFSLERCAPVDKRRSSHGTYLYFNSTNVRLLIQRSLSSAPSNGDGSVRWKELFDRLTHLNERDEEPQNEPSSSTEERSSSTLVSLPLTAEIWSQWPKVSQGRVRRNPVAGGPFLGVLTPLWRLSRVMEAPSGRSKWAASKDLCSRWRPLSDSIAHNSVDRPRSSTSQARMGVREEGGLRFLERLGSDRTRPKACPFKRLERLVIIVDEPQRASSMRRW